MNWEAAVIQGIQFLSIIVLTTLVAMFIHSIVELTRLSKRQREREAAYDQDQAQNGEQLYWQLMDSERCYLQLQLDHPHQVDITESFNKVRGVARVLLPLLDDAGPLSEEVAAKIKTELERMNNTYGYSN